MILEARQIRKVYSVGKGRLEVLKGVDLKVTPGEMVSIVGPSGAGKSTLLHILGGLDQPTEGEVRIGGDELYGLTDRERARFRNRHLGFVFQFYHLLPELNAVENVALPGMIKENTGHSKQVETQARELLTQVGLKDRFTHKPSELSGGEQQRVAIARALVNRPQIIFCDEPTGNLNSETGEEIIKLLMGLNRENKQTLVIVTHDEGIARQSSRIVHMRDGELVR